MRFEDRRKATLLEGIMGRHALAERKTLDALHTAGFTFRTIGAAQQRLKAQRTLAGFSQEQIDQVEKLERGKAS